MPNYQPDLLPPTPAELTTAAFRIAALLQEQDDAEEAFAEARDAHKEAMAELKFEIKVQRAIVTRGSHHAKARVLSDAEAGDLLRQALDDTAESMNTGVMDREGMTVRAEVRP